MPQLYELIKTIADQQQVIATELMDDAAAEEMNEKLSKRTSARWVCQQQSKSN